MRSCSTLTYLYTHIRYALHTSYKLPDTGSSEARQAAADAVRRISKRAPAVARTYTSVLVPALVKALKDSSVAVKSSVERALLHILEVRYHFKCAYVQYAHCWLLARQAAIGLLCYCTVLANTNAIVLELDCILTSASNTILLCMPVLLYTLTDTHTACNTGSLCGLS
jgi:HEAT repeat protein